MANVFKTLAIPAAQLAKAQAICDALGYPDKGTFIGKIALSGAEPMSGPDTRTMAGYIASGVIDSNSRLLGTSAALFTALNGAPGITQADCDAFVAVLEVTTAPPLPHRAAIVRECSGTEVTTVWAQPLGSNDAYPLDAAVTDAGQKWRGLVPFNVWKPPINWRAFWSAGLPPEWIQPTGAPDSYAVGALVMHLGQKWQSTTPANVWEPGVFGWVVVP